MEDAQATAIASKRATTEPCESDTRRDEQSLSRWRVPAVLAALYIAQAVVSLTLTPFGADEYDDFRDRFLELSFGVILAQPLLVAVVVGFSPWRLLWSLPAGVILLALLTHFCNFATARNQDSGDLETVIVLGGTYLALHPPILAVRWLSGLRIAVRGAPRTHVPIRQFHLSQLLAMVTVAAVILAIVRVFAVKTPWPDTADVWANLVTEMTLIGGSIALAVLGLLPFVGAVLAIQGRVWYLVAGLVGTAAGMGFILWITGPNTLDDMRVLCLFAAGVLLSLLINLWILRWCGFRLATWNPQPGLT